jgi:cereblon
MHADRESEFVCCCCRGSVARRSEVFSVPGAEGTVGAYVNPHGVVHQTVTIRQLVPRSFLLEGRRATTQDTWFPGYGWIIAYCARCYNHLGWRFVRAAGGSDAGTEGAVAAFWGVRRGAVALERRRAAAEDNA